MIWISSTCNNKREVRMVQKKEPKSSYTGSLQSRKGKEIDLVLHLPEGNNPADTLNWAQSHWFCISNIQNCKRINLCYFKATKCVVICYSSNRTLIHCWHWSLLLGLFMARAGKYIYVQKIKYTMCFYCYFHIEFRTTEYITYPH